MFANMDEETLLYACKVLVENSMKNKMNLNSPNSGQKAENLEKNFSEIKSKDNAPERKLSDEEIEADERKKIKEEEQKEREEKLRENVRKKIEEEKAAKEKESEKIKAERAARREKAKNIEKMKKQGKKTAELREKRKKRENDEKYIEKFDMLTSSGMQSIFNEAEKEHRVFEKEEKAKREAGEEELVIKQKNLEKEEKEKFEKIKEVRKQRAGKKLSKNIEDDERDAFEGVQNIFNESVSQDAEKKLNETDKKNEKDKKGGLFGKFKDLVKRAAQSMSDDIKDVVGEKKKSFNDSKFSKLTGLAFSSGEDKDEVEEKNEEPSFNTKGKFLAWLDAQDTAIKLKNNAKELKRRIERKYNFLKIYNYKSSDEGVKKILGEISSLINEEKTDIDKNIEMLKGEDLEKYLYDTAEVIDNLKLYNKKLDGIFKDKGISELDFDNDEDYHDSSSMWDDSEDKSELNIFKPLETVLKATGYFMKEIVSKLEQKDVKQLKGILDSNFYFDSSGKGDFRSTGDIQKAIKDGEEEAVEKFNKEIKGTLERSLKKFIESSCSNNKVYKFFEKICKDGLDDIDDIEESDLENLKKYMAEQEKIN